MTTLRERVNRALQAFAAAPVDTRPGEVASADARRGRYFVSNYNPDDLVGRKGLEIYDQMRRDDQVKAAISLKKMAVLATGWRIDPAGDTPQDEEIAKFGTFTLQNLEGAFEEDCLEILTALDYGYSITELVWRIYGPEEKDFAGKFGLQSLKTRAPHRFEFKTDTFGNITSIEQDGMVLPRGKFAIFSYGHEFGNWYGTSDLRAAYRPWWVKDNAYRYLGMYLERFAVPFLVAKVPPGMKDSDFEKIRSVLAGLQASTFMTLPNTIEHEIAETDQDGAKQLVESIDHLNIAIARAILMPNLLGLSGTDQGGSLARSQTSFDTFLYVIQTLRRQLAETVIMDQILKPVVDANYAGAKVPTFRFNAYSTQQKQELLKSWVEMVKVSAVVPTIGDEVQIRELHDMPPREDPEGGEDSNPLFRPRDPNAPDPMELAKIKAGSGTPQPPPGRGKKPAVFAARELAGTSERRVDFAKIDRELDALESASANALADVLTAQRDQLIGFVENRFAAGITPEGINDLQVRKMDDLQNSFREAARSAFEYGRTSLGEELDLPKEFAWGIPPREAMKFFAAKAVFFAGVMRDTIVEGAKAILFQALKDGELLRDTVLKLQDLYTPYVGDGVTAAAVSAPRLKTAVRTLATEAFNEGRKTMMARPGVEGVLKAVRYSAILDGRTTAVCKHLDGKYFRVGDPALDKATPPMHFNCRSLLVPVLITDDEKVEYISEGDVGKAIDLAGKGFV